MRKLNLENLPTKKYGNKRVVDWQNAQGCFIPFVYDLIKGKIKVERYLRGNYIEISYGKNKKILRTHQLFEMKIKDIVLPTSRRLQRIDFQEIKKQKNHHYDWKGSIGAKIPFYFNGKKGTFIIKDYKESYLSIEYQKELYRIKTVNLLYGKIAKIVSYGKFHYLVGQRIKDEYRDVTILKRQKIHTHSKGKTIKRKKYSYYCNQCGYKGIIDESDIPTSKYICRHCALKTVIKGKTDIKSAAAWMVDFFQEKDKHLVYEVRKNSEKEIYPICPQCKTIKSSPMKIATIYKQHSIGCPCCSDKVSYPEKFIQEFFKQLKVELIYQPKRNLLPWCKHYFYDFYDKKRKVIIEVQGMHHYKEVRVYKRSLQETKKVDKKKQKLALENGMTYLSIDCRYSKQEYIKQSLRKNKLLNQIYHPDYQKINFEECEKATLKSVYYEIYAYKKAHPTITYKKLKEIYNIDSNTISKAVRKIESYKTKKKST